MLLLSAWINQFPLANRSCTPHATKSDRDCAILLVVLAVKIHSPALRFSAVVLRLLALEEEAWVAVVATASTVALLAEAEVAPAAAADLSPPHAAPQSKLSKATLSQEKSNHPKVVPPINPRTRGGLLDQIPVREHGCPSPGQSCQTSWIEQEAT